MNSNKLFAGALALSFAVMIATPLFGASEASAQSTSPGRGNSPSSSSPSNPGSGPSGNSSNPIFYYQDCPRGVRCNKPKIALEKMPALCRSYYHQVTDGTWLHECKQYYDSDD
ncbi:MAG: hypothetical protein P4L82_14605 [Ancalomicrobiaceae bacterium]|nr:hypothetical protein [Ancalomicrobiaceae bacterium]